MKRALAISLTTLATLAIGCLLLSGTTSAAGGKREVTFNKDVALILYKNCAECHKPNDIAPMSLISYKEVRPWARSIKEKVVTREMPPWSPDPKYGEFRNDHRLSDKDIATIVAWVDGGAKEGNPKDLPPVPSFDDGWQLGKPDMVLAMQEEYNVEATGPDEYIRFVIPVSLTELKWIRAVEIHPGN